MEKYFIVNDFKMWSPNIQYAVIFQRERILFLKIGGQFADYPELSPKYWIADIGLGLLPLIPASVLGLAFAYGFPSPDKLPIYLGMIIGYTIGLVIVRKQKKRINVNRAKRHQENIHEIIKEGTAAADYNLSDVGRHSFDIPYISIVRLEMHRMGNSLLRGKRIGHLLVRTHNDYEFDIAPNQEYSECLRTLEDGLKGRIHSGNIVIES